MGLLFNFGNYCVLQLQQMLILVFQFVFFAFLTPPKVIKVHIWPHLSQHNLWVPQFFVFLLKKWSWHSLCPKFDFKMCFNNLPLCQTTKTLSSYQNFVKSCRRPFDQSIFLLLFLRKWFYTQQWFLSKVHVSVRNCYVFLFTLGGKENWYIDAMWRKRSLLS